jgi:hypothetical protein
VSLWLGSEGIGGSAAVGYPQPGYCDCNGDGARRCGLLKGHGQYESPLWQLVLEVESCGCAQGEAVQSPCRLGCISEHVPHSVRVLLSIPMAG